MRSIVGNALKNGYKVGVDDSSFPPYYSLHTKKTGELEKVYAFHLDEDGFCYLKYFGDVETVYDVSNPTAMWAIQAEVAYMMSDFYQGDPDAIAPTTSFEGTLSLIHI